MIQFTVSLKNCVDSRITVLIKFKNYSFCFELNTFTIILIFFINLRTFVLIAGYLVCHSRLIKIRQFVFFHKTESPKNGDSKYQVNFPTTKGNFKLDNIKRGASVIGSAGSGKTESVVYGFLKHFQKESFCGIIHDYKDFELTEMAYPLFKDGDIPFKIISFDKIIHRVNPYRTSVFRERGKRKRGIKGID